MTSAHSMFAPALGRLWLRMRIVALVAFASLFLAACDGADKLTTPILLSSPYERPQLWAVAPFRNESGVSIVKTDRVADVFVEQIEGIEGVAGIPVNRVLTAMNRMNLRSINSHQDAIALMNVLGVDGLIVGTVTSYDPYRPMKLGAAVQLYRRDVQKSMTVDPVQMTRATTDQPHTLQSSGIPDESAIQPTAQASGVFDASNHQVLLWLDEYAHGRSEPNSAYGKRIYLASMEMYTQFVAYRLLHDLLSVERARHQVMATQPK